MEWKRILLRHLLDGGYTKVILDRGKRIRASRDIDWWNIDEDGVEAEVFGSQGDVYFVDFVYSAERDRLMGNCNCPYNGPCKHQVAVLLEAIDGVRARDIPTSTADAGRSTNGSKPPTKRQSVMKNLSADKLRYLPLGDYEDVDDMFEACATRRSPNLWAQHVEGQVNPQDLSIHLEAFDVDWQRRKKVQFSIDIISDDQGIGVRCNSCTSKTDRLCRHQFYLLERVQNVLEHYGYFDQTLTLDDLYDRCLKGSGLQKDSWQKYAKLMVHEGDFFGQALASYIMPQNWIENALVHRNLHARRLTKTRIPKEWVEIPKRFECHGFLWSYEDDEVEYDTPLRFLSGNAYKSKEGLNPKGRVVEARPHLFPDQLQDFAEQCLKYSMDINIDRAFAQMKALVDDDIHKFNEIYHYIYPAVVASEAINNKLLYLVQFSAAPLNVSFNVKSVDKLIEVSMQMEVDGKRVKATDLIYKNPFFFATKSFIYLYPKQSLGDYLILFGTDEKVILKAALLPEVKLLVSDLQKDYDVTIDPALDSPSEVLSNPAYQVYIQEIEDVILLEPMLSYDAGLVNAFHKGPVVDGIKAKYIDETDRAYFLDFIQQAHPKFKEGKHHEGYLYLEGKDMIQGMWFLNFAEACKLANVELLGRDQLKKYKYSPHRGSTTLSVSSGIDWFGVDASVKFGSEEVKPKAWIQAIQRGDNYVLLKDGSYGILPEEWLEQMSKTLKVAEVERGEIKISKYRYNIIDELFQDLDDELMADLSDRRALFDNYFSKDRDVAIPSTISAHLRGYQKDGYRWLNFLDETNCGGILADDMGLGKTLQIITLLAKQSEDQLSLVVVPRSLLYNWGAEIDKFCEPLIYLIHHGPQRANIFDEIEHAQIIITTYDTLIRDVDMFKEPVFNYIILDESQAIKNPLSKRYKALRLLKARNRVAMTGTPIENNTFDLYAQLSFTSPGLLGSAKSFKDNFARPIDKEGSKDAADLLKKMIHPFILRRTKEQVAKDLPAKVEQTILCDMGPSQRRLYDQLRIKIKSDLEQAKNDKGNKGQLRFKILEGLLRLRQMCNSPYLVNKALGASADNAIKLNILSKQLTTVTEQHKVLVFSQFVGMLSLIKNMLDAEGIKYAYLDGSTRDRQSVVEAFQQDESIKVFLISLKAGNTGLNLTQADYVYIVDPWWNPAAEAQAIDRTHRIGQDKPVFAYKMICRDTIEEKILELQAKKKALASDIIQVDEDVFKQLDENTLMHLFD